MDESVRTLIFTVNDPAGFHAQSVARLVSALSGFSCDVTIRFRGTSCEARSIFEVMALGIPQGAQVELVCDGTDGEECLGALEKLATTF